MADAILQYTDDAGVSHEINGLTIANTGYSEPLFYTTCRKCKSKKVVIAIKHQYHDNLIEILFLIKCHKCGSESLTKYSIKQNGENPPDSKKCVRCGNIYQENILMRCSFCGSSRKEQIENAVHNS